METENNENKTPQNSRRNSKIAIAVLSVVTALLAIAVILLLAWNISKDREAEINRGSYSESGESSEEKDNKKDSDEDKGFVDSIKGWFDKDDKDMDISKAPKQENTTASAAANSSGGTDGSGNSAVGTTAATTAAATQSKPSTTAQIVSYYNDAVNKAVTFKAGYSKSRTTTVGSLEGGALLKIQVMIDSFNEAFGVGTKSYTNPKGSANYLRTASLSANDVQYASCTQSGGTYTITMTLKSGNTQTTSSGTTGNPAINRSGLCVGSGSNANYDYRSSENILAVLSEDGMSAEAVKETVSNVKIVATVNASTGKITSLTVSWSSNIELKKGKYSVANVEKVVGSTSSTVKFTNFTW